MGMVWGDPGVGSGLPIVAESGKMPSMIVYSDGILGFFAGMSFDQATLIEREEENHEAYGRPISASEILGGQATPPEGTLKLYEVIHAAEGSGDTGEHARSDPVTGTGDVNAEGRESSTDPPLL
ncbi:hypothetical protein FRC00_000960 [Tulasnella sp. 408]|nr:hypothetical protein FRC00_000960 [Tulasnella sp. 408]